MYHVLVIRTGSNPVLTTKNNLNQNSMKFVKLTDVYDHTVLINVNQITSVVEDIKGQIRIIAGNHKQYVEYVVKLKMKHFEDLIETLGADISRRNF